MKLNRVIWIIAPLACAATAQGASFGGLAPAQVYAVGDGPREGRAADLNGDGLPDVAVANSLSDDLTVFMNNGDGTLGTPVFYPVGDLPQSVIAADIDGDGDIDLTVANANVPSISVLKNDGTGAFTTYQTLVLPFQNGYGNIRVHTMADFDGDGDIDIAMAMLTPNKYVIVTNDGSGTFGSPQVFDETGEFLFPNDLEPADFDGDGDIDLITIYGTTTVRVYLNNGDATWTILPDFDSVAFANRVAPGDLNNDGIVDIAIANNQLPGAIIVALGNGDGTFGSQATLPSVRPFTLALADLNDDGNLDLIVSDIPTANTVSVWLGNGDGTFELPLTYASGGNVPMEISIADMNGDSWLDVVNVNFQGDNLNVFLNLTVACLADVTTEGAGVGDPGYGVPDGAVTSADIQYYVNLYISGDLAADLTTTGTPIGDPNYGVPDGMVTAADIQFYANLYVAGCP